MEENTPASNTDLTLSAALLAPLNTIFEAQVHAARSFLSFILQMGFRHKYSESEIEGLKKDATEESSRIVELYEKEIEDEKTINELKNKKSRGEKLSEEEIRTLKELLHKWDEFRSLDFEYVDDVGNLHEISIPHLAVIPVKPLAIDTASFKFEMGISKSSDFNTIRSSTGVPSDRPWYLIKPKQLSGNIISKEQSNKQAAISIEISIKSTELPAGLGKLLSTMNESSHITLKNRIDS